jgi:protein SCO1/2
MNSTRRSGHPRLLATATLAALALLGGCDRLAPSGGGKDAATGAAAAAPQVRFNAVDVTGAESPKDFKLADPAGKTRTLADFRGKDVVVFFGYTHCPDACPTMLADLKAAKQSMGPDGSKVQVVFITVDPARDSAALMKAYAENFGPDFIGLRGDEDATKAAAKEFKIFYVKVPGKTANDYTIDHSAGAYVFDPAGHVRLFVRNGATPETMAEDFKVLLKENGSA